ncbi:MAG: AbgT family transporter [Acidobacteriota bacterium]|nr:AbgT family transporter [Acidobacteriota bacterium]
MTSVRFAPLPSGTAGVRAATDPLGVMTAVKKKSGIGTVVALMLPYSSAILVVWTVLFVRWFLLGIPLGPGYPPNVP